MRADRIFNDWGYGDKLTKCYPVGTVPRFDYEVKQLFIKPKTAHKKQATNKVFATLQRFIKNTELKSIKQIIKEESPLNLRIEDDGVVFLDKPKKDFDFQISIDEKNKLKILAGENNVVDLNEKDLTVSINNGERLDLNGFLKEVIRLKQVYGPLGSFEYEERINPGTGNHTPDDSKLMRNPLSRLKYNAKYILRKRIDEAVSLIKAGKYEKATQLLNKFSRKEGKSLGFAFEPKTLFLNPENRSKDYMHQKYLEVRRSCFYDCSDVKISVPSFMDLASKGSKKQKLSAEETKYFEEFKHNVALLAVEEMLHALQHIEGVSLSSRGYQIAQEKDLFYTDEEDVLAYFVDKGVLLTDGFINVYKQRKAIYPYLVQ